jgi:hypothetical protein
LIHFYHARYATTHSSLVWVSEVYSSTFFSKDSGLDPPLNYTQSHAAKDTDLDLKDTSASPPSLSSYNPTTITPSSQNWSYQSSSYCRVQLFRLKGAQRKLKTDKLKVDRINPPDLKKRYQPSTKVTLLYNTHFDTLYSLMPFSRYMANFNGNNDLNNNTTGMLNLPHESTLDEGLFDASSMLTSAYMNNNNNLSSSASTSSISSQSSLSNSHTSYSLLNQNCSGSQSYQLQAVDATNGGDRLHQVEQQCSGVYFKADTSGMISVDVKCLNGGSNNGDGCGNGLADGNPLKRSSSNNSSISNKHYFIQTRFFSSASLPYLWLNEPVLLYINLIS